MVPVASVWVPRAPTYSGSRSPPLRISSTGFAPSSTELSFSFDYPSIRLLTVLQPQSFDWFRLLRFRSPLLSESRLFSSPPGTKMFQFPGFSSHQLCIHLWMIPHYRYRVAPFGFPRIVACLRLPEAFRRLLRPSSALYAQTSTVRSSSFNHFAALHRFLRTVSFVCFFSDFLKSLSQLFRKTFLLLSFFCYPVFKELPGFRASFDP